MQTVVELLLNKINEIFFNNYFVSFRQIAGIFDINTPCMFRREIQASSYLMLLEKCSTNTYKQMINIS